MRVIVAIDDAPADSGGFACMPCSHKLNIEPPQRVRTGVDDMSRLGSAILKQPVMAAGDVLLCVSTLGWTLRAPTRALAAPRLLHAEFIGNVSRPGGDAAFTEKMPWMDELSEAEKLVLGLPPSGSSVEPAAVVVRGDEVVRGPAAKIYHPRLLTVTDTAADQIDEEEQFFWELNGFIVLRGVMSPEWVAEANQSIETWHANGAIPAGDSPAVAGGSNLMRLPAPESLPIRKMLAHPSIVKRLNWMLGGGFRANTHGGLIEWRGDWGEKGQSAGREGHRFHAGGHPLLPEFNYHLYTWKNGRSYAGSVNCAWQLMPVREEDGGACLVPGSHKANVSNFEESPTDTGACGSCAGASFPHRKMIQVLKKVCPCRWSPRKGSS
eukprot:SAG31_NODE_3415_length_4302_cov_12.564359_1_plen_380_part_00